MKIDGNQPIGEDIDKKEEKTEEEGAALNGGGEGKAPNGREYTIDSSYYFEDEAWFIGGEEKTEEKTEEKAEEKSACSQDGYIPSKESEKSSSNYFGEEAFRTDERDVSTSGFLGEEKPSDGAERKNPNYFGEEIHPIYKEESYDTKSQNKGFGIASMILGIASIVGCCLEGMAIVPAVLAIIFASVRMKTKSDGCAVAGLITGIIGIILNLVMIFVLVFAFVESMTPPDYTETESAYELITLLLK
jgi:hypothetical protein